MKGSVPAGRWGGALWLIVGSLSFANGAPRQAVQSWTKQADGVEVRLSTGVLRVKVYNPRVIRVIFSPTQELPPRSLSVVGSPQPTPFTIDQRSNALVVSTGPVQVRVDQATGDLTFLDENGQTVLSEAKNGMSLEPTTLSGPTAEPAFKSQARFELPPDEAVYGLGQHQDGFLDYRGARVVLEQANREVAIPFLVSSRGYGLFWDNPAYTTVSINGPEQGAIVDAGHLLDKDGHPGGLSAEYFDGRNFDHLVKLRTDPKIDFDWNAAPMADLKSTNFSVKWSGYITADIAGTYTLSTTSDDGVRLYVDDRLLIDDWSEHPAHIDSASIDFQAGTRHRIRYEYFQAGGGAVARLGWTPPSTPKPPETVWSSEAASAIDFYYCYGPSIDSVIRAYRGLTGHAPMPGKWALGYWQSKERYNTQQEWLDIAKEYRSRQEPIDNLVQDWFYWDPHPWGSHAWDSARYPDPKAAIDELHDIYHMHLMTSVWGRFDTPKTADDPFGANYREMTARGYLYPNLSGYYDAFNPAARDLFWQQIDSAIFSKGVDAWWLDASEPEVDMQAFRERQTFAGIGARVLNAWPLMHTTGVYRHQRVRTEKKRVFILTRSAYAGQQRNGAATWSGDITANWKVFAAQIPAGLNFCLSGIPYWTTDIGAFFVPTETFPGGAGNPAYRELFTRWFQYGAFCPIFRAHGTNTPRELWRFGPNEPILASYDRLRYRLLPYIYSEAWQVTHADGTLMRPLVMDFRTDAVARSRADEFMFGPSLLVCPVLKAGATEREVYLPGGTDWIDFWKGTPYHGGKTTVARAPIETMPLFVRAGSIVPMGPPLQWATEKPEDPIELRIYPGADGHFQIYEDENDNYDYERGDYATIPMSWNDSARVLKIGERKGYFPGMLAHRTFRIVVVRPGHGTGPNELRTPDTVTTYTGQAMQVAIP